MALIYSLIWISGGRADSIWASMIVYRSIQLCFRSIWIDLFQFSEKLMLQWMVFYLLHRVQIDSVVVSAKLFSFEELDGSLIQLEDNNLN